MLLQSLSFMVKALKSHPPRPQCPSLLHSPGQCLGSQLCNNTLLRLSDYHSLQSDRRIPPQKHTVSLTFSRTSVERLPFSNLLPTCLVKLISCCLQSLHSSHILNLEAKFLDLGMRQSMFKSLLHHWPAVGPGQASQFLPQSQLHICP